MKFQMELGICIVDGDSVLEYNDVGYIEDQMIFNALEVLAGGEEYFLPKGTYIMTEELIYEFERICESILENRSLAKELWPQEDDEDIKPLIFNDAFLGSIKNALPIVKSTIKAYIQSCEHEENSYIYFCESPTSRFNRAKGLQ